MTAVRALAPVLALLVLAGGAAAGPMNGVGVTAADVGRGVGRTLDEAIDVGPEVSVLQSFADGGHASAVGVDLVIAAYADDAVTLESSLPDRLLGRRPRRRWPFLSHQALSLHAGGVFDVDGERGQLHLAVGSGLGPVGIAIAALREFQPGPNAWGFGPELRLRHRFGPSRHTPSVGLLVRGEFYVSERDAHPDRVTVGAFAMWGW